MSNNRYSTKEIEALRYIRNRIVHDGKAPSLRDIMSFLGYKSPRSALVMVDKFIVDGIVKRKLNGELQLLVEPEESRAHGRTVNVPLVGSVPCGLPLLAEENLEMMIPVSTRLAKPPHRYFLLRAVGNSMDKRGIKDGNLVLVKQQSYADNGESVVALIDDKATVKELYKGQNAVILKPRSTNSKHKPIILTDDFQIQGVVVASLPSI